MTDAMPVETTVAYSRAHGVMAKPLYGLPTTPVAGHDAVQAVSEEHLAHQVALERNARAIAERDPMHRHGAPSFRVRPWILNEGAIDIRINLPTSRIDFR